MTTMYRTLATTFLMLFALVACSQSSTRSAHQTSPLLSFEFLGCGGDWPSDAPFHSTIRRLTAGDKVTFLVRHPETCGLTAARNPTFRVDRGVLRLDYELYSPNDSAVMCDCEYFAQFTFDDSMMMVRQVSFDGEDAQNVWSE